MARDLAILACGGTLPVRIAAACPDAMIVTLQGVPSDLAGRSQVHRLERIGGLFEALKSAGIARIVFAGALTRPSLNPAEFDPVMEAIAPRLTAAMGQGDDGLLRTVVAIFEEQGVQVVGAHDLLPDLVAEDGLLIGDAPDAATLSDASRAADILNIIAPLDIGQSCVVAGGQCLGIETVQGTDALLDYVASLDPALRRGHRGVFVKAAKAGQDLRIDMPAIGPGTVAGVAAAGLAGLVIEAGRVMILEREKTLQAVAENGLFLSARGL